MGNEVVGSVSDLVVFLVVPAYGQRVEEKEIYPNAPLVLIALEVRHPYAAPLSSADQRKIKQRLSQALPIQRTAKITKITGAIGSSTSPSVEVESFPKYFSRDSTVSLSFRNTAVVVETTRYNGWQAFRGLIVDALKARSEVGLPDGVERVGLRYVNEVRVPVEGPVDWGAWVDLGLLGPMTVAKELGFPAVQWQGLTVFTTGTSDTLALRHGSTEGYAVDPGGDLKRPRAGAPGPFFLIDIDSFYTPSQGVPEFDVDELLSTADRLHSPVDDVFETLITENLRREVLRDGGDG